MASVEDRRCLDKDESDKKNQKNKKNDGGQGGDVCASLLWQQENALDIHSLNGIIRLIKPITNTVRTTAMPCHGCPAAAAFTLLLRCCCYC
jgi:hypothetical protein